MDHQQQPTPQGNQEGADDIGIAFEIGGRIAWITLNRPEVRNALGASQWSYLADLMDDCSIRSDVGVVIIRGVGDSFCAGGDINTFSDDGKARIGSHVLRALTSIRRCRKPVIAMVNGVAVGGGNEIVIACDFALAARGARLGQAGTLIGACPVIGGTNMLTLQIGEKRAREIVFFSRKVEAEQALAWGWVNAVADPDDLESLVTSWADELLRLHPQALQVAKSASNVWWNASYGSMVNGMEALALGVDPESMAEGRQAFLEKRQPDFSPWH